METSGVLGPEAHNSSKTLDAASGRQLHGEQRSFQFLLQRVAVAVQRGNVVAVLRSMKGFTELGWERLRLGFIFF